MHIELTSSTAPGVTHRWTNLSDFADEVANARIWAGFHYRFSTRVGTEMGILHTMKKHAPDKELIPVPYEDRSAACQGCNQCPHMKLNTLEKIYLALRDLRPRIELPEDLRRRALVPLQRMLELS